MDIFKNVFNRKTENFYKAKDGLKLFKRKFDGFVITFPDITSDEIMFIKDKWEWLPKNIGRGVKIMALHFNNTVKLFLTSYEPNSYIMPHKHIIEFEIGKIIEGSLTNLLTGVTYKEGDTYKFYPDEIHYLESSKKGCMVQSVLSLNEEYDFKPYTKTKVNLLKSI